MSCGGPESSKGMLAKMLRRALPGRGLDVLLQTPNSCHGFDDFRAGRRGARGKPRQEQITEPRESTSFSVHRSCIRPDPRYSPERQFCLSDPGS